MPHSHHRTNSNTPPAVTGTTPAVPVSDRDAQQRALRGDERVNAEARHELIAEAAYYNAERRGFTPGRELDDWLAAEAELIARLGLETESSAYRSDN